MLTVVHKKWSLWLHFLTGAYRHWAIAGIITAVAVSLLSGWLIFTLFSPLRGIPAAGLFFIFTLVADLALLLILDLINGGAMSKQNHWMIFFSSLGAVLSVLIFIYSATCLIILMATKSF